MRLALELSLRLCQGGTVEQLLSHGGFMVSGAEAVRHLHDDDCQE
jgi:hypothetical protein